VVTGADGIALFDALHCWRRASDAILYAFARLKLNGEDLRPLPLSIRKEKLARLRIRKPAGIALNEHVDPGGAAVFGHACKKGLEGALGLGALLTGRPPELGKIHRRIQGCGAGRRGG
jgi:bifunctional non-homologous end joining protein LigD